MKRFFTILCVFCGLSAIAAAQPRSAGIRIGASGFEASYTHKMNSNQFIEGNAGLDFGYNGKAGFKATGIYNVIWARPAWTDKGSWALYAGPGASIGWVNDICVHKADKEVIGYMDSGFMLAVAVQVGIEYNFDFPLQLALDVRPCIGLHINDGRVYDNNNEVKSSYGSTVGFYDKGLRGFIPSLSVRYSF